MFHTLYIYSIICFHNSIGAVCTCKLSKIITVIKEGIWETVKISGILYTGELDYCSMEDVVDVTNGFYNFLSRFVKVQVKESR